MKDYRITLSKESTEMFNNMLDDMEMRKYDALNIPLLIAGIIEADNGMLKDVLESQNVDNSELPPAIEALFYDHDKMLDSIVEDNKNKEKNQKDQKNQKEETGETKEDSKDEENDESKEVKTKEDLRDELFKKKEHPEWESQINMAFEINDYRDKPLILNLDSYMATIIENIIKTCIDEEVNVIEPCFFVTSLFETNMQVFKGFLKELEVLYSDIKKEFTRDKIYKKKFIPTNLESFLFEMNEKIDVSKPCEILKRDEEVDKLWNIMLKKNKRNAVIVGEAGVGKTALVEKITYEIENMTSPEEFSKFKVIALDVNSLIAGTHYRGDAEERIQKLIEFLKEKDNVILFIDEVHTILGAGACIEGEMDLANALKPILARGDTIVIGATTMDEYEKYFKKDAALNRRFEMVVVREPKFSDVYEMIKNKISILSKYHKIKITKRMVEYAIMIASCFAFEKKNPDKTLDLIDRAMVAAKRDGKTEVDKEAILKNFDIFFKMWEGMTDEQKLEIAYHELGHYIVGKASDKLVDQKYLAVSIMPAEFYLGVTVYEKDHDMIPYSNIDYFIDLIAASLGGRAGENRYRDDFTSGASQDLKNATKTAFRVVSKLGMGNDKLKNKIYLNSEENPMFSEKAINKLNKETDKLIKQAYARANEILNDNEDILEALVPVLVERRIMSEKELDSIWCKVVKKRKK